MLLRNYLKLFRQSLEKFENYGYTESIEIKEEIRPNKQAIIKAKTIFINRSVLHIKEYIYAKYKIEKVNYAYQYQDKNGGLIFRYDNANHRPSLGFKQHKHTMDGVIIEASLPDISDIIDEVIGCL